MSLKRQYVNILKNHLFSLKSASPASGVKFKEIISDMKCEILKPFYKRPGTITLTSHEIIFFDELLTGPMATLQ